MKWWLGAKFSWARWAQWVHLAETEGGQGPGGPLRARSEEKPTQPTASAVCFRPIPPQREPRTDAWAHGTSPFTCSHTHEG